jgi:hypothetical protein
MKPFGEYLTEAKVKAEDYEASIVMAFYEMQGKEIDSKSGVSSNIADNILSNPTVLETGRKIAKYIVKKYPATAKAQAEQYGRASTSLTGFWKSHGATNKTPKTDILIGKMRFSLKIGLAQLMSGGASESTATFMAAVEESNKDLKESRQFKTVSGILDNFVKNSIAPTKLRPLIKNKSNDLVNKGEKAHKDVMGELGKMFQENRDFKIEFAREAMSGFKKFGTKDNAAAEFMLVSNHSGSDIKIHSVYDDSYCATIADNMRLQARFKTSGRRVGGKKTGEYNFWSVISLIVDAAQEAYVEEGRVLNEGMFDKVKQFASKTWNRVTSFFKKSVNNMLKFMGLIPVIKLKSKIRF